MKYQLKSLLGHPDNHVQHCYIQNASWKIYRTIDGHVEVSFFLALEFVAVVFFWLLLQTYLSDCFYFCHFFLFTETKLCITFKKAVLAGWTGSPAVRIRRMRIRDLVQGKEVMQRRMNN